MPNDKHDDHNEKVVYKTPPKSAFIMGALVGITLASLVAFVMTYSLLRADLTESSNSNTSGTVAGIADDAGSPTPTPAPVVVDIEVTADDHIRGDVNAPVTLVEYSDFECPFCGRVQPTLETLLEEYDGQINHVFRHFPLSFHPSAQKAGEASECAADQGKFWEMHEAMFTDQSKLSVDDLKKYASDLGLNTSTFNDCLDSGKYESKVTDGIAEGSAVGVQGTPATFVNGTLVSGAQPIEAFRAAIDAELGS